MTDDTLGYRYEFRGSYSKEWQTKLSHRDLSEYSDHDQVRNVTPLVTASGTDEIVAYRFTADRPDHRTIEASTFVEEDDPRETWSDDCEITDVQPLTTKDD